MQRFVYTPKVEAFVRCDGDGSGRIVDLTEDIVDGQVTRQVDAMSTASLTLQNKFGRYTGGSRGTGGPNAVRIRPMDRIIVRMSRVSEPFLTFSGYVDESPYFQLYPGTITIRASCTLKLLANTYFDPGLPLMREYFRKFGWIYDVDSGTLQSVQGKGNTFGYLDVAGGIGDVMWNILHDIGNLPYEAIDIGDLPLDFLSSISSAMTKEVADNEKDRAAQIARLAKFLGTTASASPSTTDPAANPQTGNIPIEQVARLAMSAGFTGDDLVTAVAVAHAESNLKTDAMGYNGMNPVKTYDVGLWQVNTLHMPGEPSGGVSLPPPPNWNGGHQALNNPGDWNKIKASFDSAHAAFIERQFDPKLNAQDAYTTFKAQGWTAWSTYPAAANNFRTVAQQAVQAVALTPNADTVVSTTDTTASSTTTDPATGKTKTGTTERQKTAAEKGSTIATNVVAIAIGESQKGIVEQGGENQGPEILKYQQYVGLTPGPSAQWCAAFVSWCFGQAGKGDVKSAAVSDLDALGTEVSTPQPSDLIHWDSEHIGLVTAVSGNNVSYVAGNEGDGVRPGSVTIGSTTARFVRLPGVGSAAADAGLTGATDAGAASNSADPTTAGLQGAWLLLQTQKNDSTLSLMLTGERAIANDISLLGWISQICKSSGRSFMSKPNGEFFAFFPDYFNFYTNTPYFRVSDIELQDFTVYENDTELTTHMFGAAPISTGWNAGIGDITLPDRQDSVVASVEADAFRFFINVDPDNPQLPVDKNKHFDVYNFLRRYGARPYQKDFVDIAHPVLLWIATWMEFTQQWAKTYTADATFTFLPELFPGTVVEIGQAGGVTMYVEEVTHSFSRDGGFQTDARLTSPASISGKNGLVTSGTFGANRFTDYIDVASQKPDLTRAPFK
jgi:hypothetical protein